MPKRRTVRLDVAGARARLKEAQLHLAAAELLDLGAPAENKVAGSNAILAGTAAADAICGLVLGKRSAGDDHADAEGLLRRATHPSTKAAGKTPVQYGTDAISASDASDLVAWALDIVREAEARDR
ncbi:hypothetical protein SCB71_04875 [Herbiconiux sp. KACC 21604]|uniref:hypothetical protein n=1 Tax=unclassified Herbiconiux TaxID=2618217 RepID=UPI0014923B03|nr:hypothetical protein [Herbiconiux sp. SALV-R1]QJU52683.1 hypothetical protein HL652_02855 [Herbiconiux sp. SALV-R1]WPO87581.1 hypothetical protein SCB71_04875 [Herbiconiux sp. KACC 21604]